MTMLQHLAPRIIQCQGFCSRPILVNTSILAGCKHSVALTRALFLSGMTQIIINNPPRLYVDDTVMITHGDNQEATHKMYDAIEDFVRISQSLGLKLSTKGIIISKKSGAAQIIVNELRKK